MRITVFAGLVVGAMLVTRTPTGAALPVHVDIRADTIAFFPDRGLLAAEGRVRVVAGDRTVTADALRYELQSNRLLTTGNVHVQSPRAGFEGAMYALDLVSDGATLVRVGDSAGTVTLTGDDLDDSTFEPGSAPALEVVNVSGLRPYISSTHAIVTPSVNVRFSPATFSTSTGVAPTTPTYLYTFASASGLTTSVGQSATFDQPYGIYGSAHALAAAHLRYDVRTGIRPGFEERLFDGDRSYLVGSIVPGSDGRTDLVGYRTLSSRVTGNLSASHLVGNDSARLSFQHSSSKFTSLLASSQNNGQHTDELTMTSVYHTIPRLLGYSVRAGFAVDRNAGGEPFPSVFRSRFGGRIAPPHPFHGPLSSDVNLSYDVDSTTSSFAHQLITQNLTASFTRSWRRGPANVSLYGLVSFANIANRYGAAFVDLLGLPDPTKPYFAPDGTPYPGYFAYYGVRTNRTYQLQTTLAPNPRLNLQVTTIYTNDFPQFHGFGRPPLTALVNLRLVTPSNLQINLGRSYTFGWNGQYLGAYTLSIVP